MFTYSERDQHRMLPPAKTHLPVKPAFIDSGLLEPETRDSEVAFIDTAEIKWQAVIMLGFSSERPQFAETASCCTAWNFPSSVCTAYETCSKGGMGRATAC